MINYPREPVPGGDISPTWGRDVVRCLRASRVIAGKGVRVEDGPNGQRVSATVSSSGAGVSAIAGPWSISLEEAGSVWTATISNCYFKRGSSTLVAGEDGVLTFELPAVQSKIFMGFEYNSESGEAEIISSGSLAAVCDQSVTASEKHLVRSPLYILDVGWRVALDMRSMPATGLYI